MTAPTTAELRACTTVTIAQASAYLGLSVATGYRAAAEGTLPTIQVGKHRRVPCPLLLRLVGLDWEATEDDTEPVAAQAIT